MKNIRLISVTCLTGLLLTSCDDMQGCKEDKYSSALVYDFPDSIQAGVAHNLKIEYIIENSCGSFVDFEETVTGQTTEVRVKLLYEGCNCNLQFTEDSSLYELKQDSAGTYMYKFYQGESDYDTYNLHVYN